MWGRRKGRLEEVYDSSGDDEEDPRTPPYRRQGGVFSTLYRGSAAPPSTKAKHSGRVAAAPPRKRPDGVVASLASGLFGSADKEKLSPQRVRAGTNARANRTKRRRAMIIARRKRLFIGVATTVLALLLFMRPSGTNSSTAQVPVPPLSTTQRQAEKPHPIEIPQPRDVDRKPASFQNMFRRTKAGDQNGDDDDPDAVDQLFAGINNTKSKTPPTQPHLRVPDDMGGDHKLNALSHAKLSHHFKQESEVGIPEAMHLEFWTGAVSPTITVDGGSPKEEAVRACRIPRACRLENGTILLPAFFKAQRDRLASCGLFDPLFVLPRDKRLPEKHGGFHLDTSSYQLDLVDIQPVQGSYPPLMLIDLMPAFFSLNAINAPEKTRTQCTCFTGLQKCGSSCETVTLHPAVMATQGLWDILETSEKSTSWESEVLDEMQQSPMDMSLVHESKLYPSYLGGLGAVCFNSLITTPVPYTDVVPETLNTDYLFFADNGTVSRRLTKAANPPKPNICHIDLTISQKEGEREMKGIFSLKDKLIARFKKYSGKKKSIILSVHIAHFDNMTYSEQVKSVVNSNILVAPHADSLMNAIFLRKGSLLLEVFPFSYHPTIFNWYAALRGVNYSGYMAEPDTATFKKCMEEKYPEDSHHKSELFEKWTEAAAKYKEGNLSPHLRLEYQKTSPLKHAGVCAKKQMLRFDPEKIADAVETAAVHVCGADE